MPDSLDESKYLIRETGFGFLLHEPDSPGPRAAAVAIATADCPCAQGPKLLKPMQMPPSWRLLTRLRTGHCGLEAVVMLCAEPS